MKIKVSLPLKKKNLQLVVFISCFELPAFRGGGRREKEENPEKAGAEAAENREHFNPSQGKVSCSLTEAVWEHRGGYPHLGAVAKSVLQTYYLQHWFQQDYSGGLWFYTFIFSLKVLAGRVFFVTDLSLWLLILCRTL